MSRVPTLRDMEDWGDACDEAYDRHVQRQIDDEAELQAKRNAAQTSPEILSLIDAGNAGRQAGMMSHGASMNPYDHGTPEYAEWEKHRINTIGARLGNETKEAA